MGENRLKQIALLRVEIKFRLSLKGYTLQSLADLNGIRLGTLRKAFYIRYPRGEKIIGSALEMEPSILWPDRYTKDGRPLKRGPQKSRRPINTTFSADVKENLMAPEKEDAE